MYMKRITKLFSLLTAVCMVLSVACETAPVEEQKSTELSVTLEKNEITIDGNGGTYSVGYSIENGINGIDIAAETDVEWISKLTSAENRLYFTCEKNFTDRERLGTIAVRYPNYSTQTIKIKQAASDALTFELEICDIKTTSCSSKLYPSDKETPYIVYMAEKDYIISSNITNERELFNDDYQSFTKWANDAGATNLEAFMFSNEICFKGDSYIGWAGMVPDREYILYAYAIEFNEEGTDYTLASPITYEMVILPTQVFGEIEFDVNITIDGPKATYEFEPIGWDGKYYIDIYQEGDYMYLDEGETPDTEYCKQVANTWIGMINIYMQSGYSADQLLNLMCLQGPDSYSEVRLSDTKYCMIFYGIEMVDGLPQVTTRPYVVHFQTEKVEASDMTIDIKVDNCYVRVADLTITPSKDEPYVATFLKKNDLPYSDNKQIINWLIDYDLSAYTGAIQSNVLGLEPDTEYSVLAFGYYGGVVTTDLFRYDFKTEPEGVCENSVIGITHNGPYSLVDLETAMPDTYYNYGMFEMMGSYVMWAEVETEKQDGNVFMRLYSPNDIIADKAAVEADLKASSPKSRVSMFTPTNEQIYVFCAVAMDYKGNYSEMYISEPFSYTYSAENKRDINEFLDKMGYQPETQSATTSNIDLRLKL